MLEQKLIENSPEIARHLKQTTINMLCVARDVTGEVVEEDGGEERRDFEGELEENSFEKQRAFTDGKEGNSSLSSSSTSSLSSRCTSATPELEIPQAHDFPGYCSTVQPGYPTTLHSEANHVVPSFELPFYRDETSSLPGPSVQFQHDSAHHTLPAVSFTCSLPPPRSYSAHERTFGRRLHRASQEGGFLLASMNCPPPTWYLKVFGFCLNFETRDEIRDRMRDAVSQSRDSTLNNWRYPFTNLGGAGLFYPDVNNWTAHHEQATCLPIGNRSLQHEEYRPSELTGFSMGPFLPAVEEVRDLRLNPLLRILDPGFQGDFFDADEIEICLRGYGVTIPPNKDFVTAKIDMARLESVQVPFADFNAGGPEIPDDLSIPQVCDETAGLPPLSDEGMEEITEAVKKMVTVDVERLITCKLSTLIDHQV